MQIPLNYTFERHELDAGEKIDGVEMIGLAYRCQKQAAYSYNSQHGKEFDTNHSIQGSDTKHLNLFFILRLLFYRKAMVWLQGNLDSNRTSAEEDKLLSKKVLLRDGDITITREHEFSPEILAFLDDTTWGTTDTLYEHDKTEERLRHLTNPVLAVLREKGVLLATVVIERRQVQIDGDYLNGFFFRYLASKVPFRKRRLVGKYARRLMRLIVDDEENEAIFYASVEGRNFRSYNFLSKMGYREQAEVCTLGYSRFWPKADKRLEQISSDHHLLLHNQLKKFYRNHALSHFTHVFQEQNYFVLREKGEIIAGCQAHPATWVVKNIPGKFGGFFLRILPYIPFIRTIFNPNKFRFITFEGLVVKQGREQDLVALFEAVLHHFSVKAALVWFDVKDPLGMQLKKIGKHGIMRNFVDAASIKIMAIPEKISEKRLDQIRTKPLYISTFDFI